MCDCNKQFTELEFRQENSKFQLEKMNVLFLIAISIAFVNVVVLEVSIVLVSNNFSINSKIWQAFLLRNYKKMVIHFCSANEDDLRYNYIPKNHQW